MSKYEIDSFDDDDDAFDNPKVANYKIDILSVDNEGATQSITIPLKVAKMSITIFDLFIGEITFEEETKISKVYTIKERIKIPLPNFDFEVLKYIVKYMKNHWDNIPDEIDFPLEANIDSYISSWDLIFWESIKKKGITRELKNDDFVVKILYGADYLYLSCMKNFLLAALSSVFKTFYYPKNFGKAEILIFRKIKNKEFKKIFRVKNITNFNERKEEILNKEFFIVKKRKNKNIII